MSAKWAVCSSRKKKTLNEMTVNYKLWLSYFFENNARVHTACH